MRRSPRLIPLALCVALLATGCSAVADLPASGGGSSPGGLAGGVPKAVGAQADRDVPAIPLVDRAGHRLTLAAFRGKVVVLAPFMTLCHEQCPMTTGAFIEMHRAVVAAHLQDRVAFVEATVDPGRDTPARLRAYSRRAGLSWDHLLTGTPAHIADLWRFFGIWYRKVPIKGQRVIDWWTHKPETYDVRHQDALFVLDATGHERMVMVGMPDMGGHLPVPFLAGLLNSVGRQNLKKPAGPSWTAQQGLADIGHLLGRRIPAGA